MTGGLLEQTPGSAASATPYFCFAYLGVTDGCGTSCSGILHYFVDLICEEHRPISPSASTSPSPRPRSCSFCHGTSMTEVSRARELAGAGLAGVDPPLEVPDGSSRRSTSKRCLPAPPGSGKRSVLSNGGRQAVAGLLGQVCTSCL